MLRDPEAQKRTAPEGTPDREAEARSKMPSTELMPRALVQENQDPISKVEMSAATISALRTMMRDEIKNGMMEMEQRFANKLGSAIHGIKEDLAAEKAARQQLEDRISHLEQHRSTRSVNGNVHENDDVEDVNKSVVVIGGFIEKALEEAEAMVQQMMIGKSGYKDVEMIDSTPPIALSTFESPMQAMKFIRTQRRNAIIQTNKLWASHRPGKGKGKGTRKTDSGRTRSQHFTARASETVPLATSPFAATVAQVVSPFASGSAAPRTTSRVPLSSPVPANLRLPPWDWTARR